MRANTESAAADRADAVEPQTGPAGSFTVAVVPGDETCTAAPNGSHAGGAAETAAGTEGGVSTECVDPLAGCFIGAGNLGVTGVGAGGDDTNDAAAAAVCDTAIPDAVNMITVRRLRTPRTSNRGKSETRTERTRLKPTENLRHTYPPMTALTIYRRCRQEAELEISERTVVDQEDDHASVRE